MRHETTLLAMIGAALGGVAGFGGVTMILKMIVFVPAVLVAVTRV